MGVEEEEFDDELIVSGMLAFSQSNRDICISCFIVSFKALPFKFLINIRLRLFKIILVLQQCQY